MSAGLLLLTTDSAQRRWVVDVSEVQRRFVSATAVPEGTE